MFELLAVCFQSFIPKFQEFQIQQGDLSIFTSKSQLQKLLNYA